ncbi:Ig domain-containing protein [Leptospira interrogans]|uniref:Ig domain-containing protein n=1 Tax=Leptospira interrogans TaxID=173 RepID=UPI0002BEE5AA|nr:Ig domain-containing protein [Leptospira interrogans]EMN98276.1 Ig domain protein [Leptospira interrogans serovar Pomona str. UT364]
MKKIMLILLLFCLVFASCEDEKKDEGSITGNSIMDLLLLQEVSTPPCPGGVTMMDIPSTINAQVGTSVKSPFLIQFSAGSVNHETLMKNKNCNFSELSVTNLPAGLTLNSTTGAINGAPTAISAATTVTFSAKLKANNSTPITFTKTTTVTIFAAGSLTCNTAGAALGCNNAALPYSCPNSNFCYSTYSSCQAAEECGY